MIPTITGLTKERLVTIANDVKPLESAIDKVVSDVVDARTEIAANDIEDTYQKTMDRISRRHSGHGKKYRDEKGRFIKREDAVANDKIDYYEKTMDRIMLRHNGHDRDEEVVSANTNAKLVDRGPNVAPLHEYLKSDNNEELSGPIDMNREIIPLMQAIEENTLRTSEVLENIEGILDDMTDSMGVDNLRARERELEELKDLMAGMAGPNSSMAPEGKYKGKEWEKEDTSTGGKILQAVGSFGTAAVTGAVALGTELIADMLPQQKPNEGGGRGAEAPKPAPKPSPAPKKPSTPMLPVSEDLGSVSSKYESGGRGVATISSGRGDPGGVSYGKHQLSSKAGTLEKFFEEAEGRPFAKFFKGLKPGTKAFNDRYKQVAKSHAAAFEKAQQDFITRTHYKNVEEYARKKGIDTSQRGIQEALYSQSVQHGLKGNKKIIDRVLSSGVNLKDHEAVIRELYDERGNYVSGIKGVSRSAGRDRYNREVKDALMVQRQQGRGANINRQSAQNGAARPNVTINNNSQTNNSVNSQNGKGTPRRVPSARPVNNSIFGNYFGGPKY